MIISAAYHVKTNVFEGPFDLLLKAIDDGKINIYHVFLAEITSAYFEYWKNNDPGILLASDFLCLAAYFLEMKSKHLLPQREPLPEQKEDLAQIEASLALHIEEYQIFKQMALDLKSRKEFFARVYSRHEGDKEEKEICLSQVSLKDLVSAFKKVYDEAANREKIMPILAEEITLEARLCEIKNLLSSQSDGLAFEDLFIRKTRLEVVVTFLSILELAKQRLIDIVQGSSFGSILIKASN